LATKLSDELQDTLLEAARAAAKYAYIPYSRFPVGAAILTADGAVVSGCNVEIASYGLTVCAERNAVFSAVAAGHTSVRAVAVSASLAPGTTPCGACRQVLNEFKPADADLVVILDDTPEPRVTTLAALLPDAFGPVDIDRAEEERRKSAEG
jgi:cytidine deaminase